MSNLERDLDFLILKTQQLFTIIEQEEYQLLETKELIRKQLIDQFFIDYSAADISAHGDKFESLVNLSTNLTEQCEDIFEQTKHNILKVKQVNKIKKAYK